LSDELENVCQCLASRSLVPELFILQTGFNALSLLTMLDRIKIDPNVCDGKPTIRGLRITVDFVLKLLGDRYSAEDIVREYPELEKDDVYQAAKYGAWLASEKTTALG
jgi:uncharacterized protein (DUF433 family)